MTIAMGEEQHSPKNAETNSLTGETGNGIDNNSSTTGTSTPNSNPWPIPTSNNTNANSNVNNNGPSSAPEVDQPPRNRSSNRSPALSIGSSSYIGSLYKMLPMNDQIKELQTIIRDKNTKRSDFVFYADRLIRLIVEEGLNLLGYEQSVVTTPTGQVYNGLKFLRGNCGVSIVRSGEAMERGLRDCCRSIRIGKILVQSDEDTSEARVLYAKFPEDISNRKVLLMYPIMSTGNTVSTAVRVLQEHGVSESNIILLNLFATPQAASVVARTFPQMHVLTSEIHPVAPNHFGQRYFGTD